MTLLWDVQAAVQAALTAALNVPVYDAAELIGNDPRAFVTVGEPGENGDTATASHDMSALGNLWTDEAGEIPCLVSVWTGDTDPVAPRATANALLTASIAAINADRTLGGLLNAPGLARISAVRLREGQTSKGALIQAGFTVSYAALLT